MNPVNHFPDQGDVHRRHLPLLFCLVGIANADLMWDFATPDQRPGAVGGVYGYLYPSSKSLGQTAKHKASLQQWVENSDKAARMSFHLDGNKFPAAGFGLMFDNAEPIDLRSMTSIRVLLRADRPRKVRFSLAPSDSALKIAADTGVTFGRDTVVGPHWIEWIIRSEDVSWPRWATTPPTVRREEILSRVFALQFDIGCETKNGICDDDSGFLDVDDVQLIGAGGRWNAPEQGDCSGDTLWIDRFATGPDRQNDVGGWWYAYTDRTSADSSARGGSRILNASNPDSADTWVGPDGDSGSATLAFRLNRWKVYSGYAAMETQLASPDENSKPQAGSYQGAKAISFRIRFSDSFPEALGGVVVHLRRKGRFFENGRDHQIRIPISDKARDWCLDLSTFKQPSWSEWVEAFRPDSLLALSYEVRLPSSLDEAASSFQISRIAFHGEMHTGVAARAARGGERLLRTHHGWIYERSASIGDDAAWQIRQADGRKIASGVLSAGEARFALPDMPRGLSILTIRSASFRILQP